MFDISFDKNKINNNNNNNLIKIQLTLMAGNLNSSVTNSPCCTISENQSSTNTNPVNINMNNGNLSDSSHSEPLAPSNAHQLTPTSSSSSTMCSLTTPSYESRLINSYSRLSGFYGSSYTDQNSFYHSPSTFYSSFVRKTSQFIH